MSIDVTFRNWVRRHPHPSKLRVDGQHEIVIGTGRTKWLDATKAFLAVDGRECVALDKDGGILRTLDLRSEEEAEAEEEAASFDERMRRVKSEREAEREELRMLGEQNQHIQFAKLLMQASQQGAETVRSTVGDVLTAYGSLVQVLSERLVGVERALASNLAQQKADILAQTPGADSVVENAIQGMLARAVGGGGGASNGKVGH